MAGHARRVKAFGNKDGEQPMVTFQLILDEPPSKLYEDWVKSRLEYYKRGASRCPSTTWTSTTPSA